MAFRLVFTQKKVVPQLLGYQLPIIQSPGGGGNFSWALIGMKESFGNPLPGYLSNSLGGPYVTSRGSGALNKVGINLGVLNILITLLFFCVMEDLISSLMVPKSHVFFIGQGHGGME